MRMRYLKPALLTAGVATTLLLVLFMSAVIYIVFYDSSPNMLVVYATTESDLRNGGQYLIPPLARLRLHSLKTCPKMGDSSAMAYIVTTHSLSEADKAAALELGETFLRIGCDVNDYGQSRWTPLHVAILENDAPMVDFLLQHGADPHLRILPPKQPGQNARPTDGMDAYEFAAWIRDHGKVKQDMSAVMVALQHR